MTSARIWESAWTLRFLLWRPAGHFAARLQQLKTRFRLGSGGAPAIGMHVRHGDSCLDLGRGHPCMPLR